jgi:molybdate transport system ATP-binding protein
MVSTENQNKPPLPWLSVENITIRAKNRLCFAGTNWCMHADEQWAVIGATGGGKSIFVKALSGRLPVVQGQIVNYFDGMPNGRPYVQQGEVILVSAETQRDVLQQHAGFHQARWQSSESDGVPTVTEFLNGESVDDRVTYDINPPGMDKKDQAMRRTHAIDLLEIGGLLDRKIIHLSYGEGRKVSLARALMQSPKLLILDDPFGGLDADSRLTLIRSLTAILESRQQRLLLVASREEEIPDGITHVLGIAGHKIVTQGPKAAVCASSFAQGVFKAGSEAVHEELKLPATGWSVLPPGTPLIEFSNVTVKYQGVSILKDVNWTMRQGEHWAIRGPNGAGKSTLLSLILADNPQAYANEVTVFGRRRGTGESIWDIKQHIGWVAPETAMFYQSRVDCQTVVCSGFYDSVGLYQNVTSDQSRAAAKWMKILSIDSLAEQQFQEVSIGEQRLVLLARALVKQPRLLILDEPCQGLDSSHRTRILHVLDALCRQTPISLLYVTHHLDELPQAITHVLHLKQGRMQVND